LRYPLFGLARLALHGGRAIFCPARGVVSDMIDLARLTRAPIIAPSLGKASLGALCAQPIESPRLILIIHGEMILCVMAGLAEFERRLP